MKKTTIGLNLLHKMVFESANYVAFDLGVGDDDWDFSQLDVKSDVQSLPIRDSIADAALNLWVMEHVPAPQLMVDEMFRILKPGGKIFLIVPFTMHEHQQPYDFYRYTRFGVQHLFETAGFANVEVYSDSSTEFAAAHEAHKWLSALAGMLTMRDEQRNDVGPSLIDYKSIYGCYGRTISYQNRGICLKLDLYGRKALLNQT